MLNDQILERVLARLPALAVGVVGDLFLDRYLDIDAALTETSVETGLDAYQVVAVRSSPGAAGTVINNLAALGVGRIVPVSIRCDDAEGFDLIRSLVVLPGVDCRWICEDYHRRTPAYVKPMLHQARQPPRELNRLDFKNRTPLAGEVHQVLLDALARLWPELDALIVVDQVSEPECGVITSPMRLLLRELADTQPDKFILADSRERIGLFRSVCIKPNESECVRAAFGDQPAGDVEAAARTLAERTGRTVFCTRGEAGILLAQPEADGVQLQSIPAFPVTGPIDIVGAGDSASAAITAAVASGANMTEAAAFGNLVASITIQQLGTTGTASPRQVCDRWHQLTGGG